MHQIHTLVTVIALVAGALASCDHNSCYEAVEHHQSTESNFCKKYLATSTVSVTCHLADYSPHQISSACSCLSVSSDASSPHTTHSSTFNPSTCARGSISACPTPYDPCCAFICAEAEVPFNVCSPKNETVLAQCSKCPPPTSFTATPVSTTKKSVSRPSATITSTPTTLLATTCTPRLLTTAACPTPYDPCCAWNCEEAEVPFNVCSQMDGSGEFALCTKCPSPIR